LLQSKPEIMRRSNYTFKGVITLLLINIMLIALPAQDHARWLRYASISPDGTSILFNYKGDIYTVSSSGGIAKPLTLSASHEYAGVWSNDSKHIAFASDRYGNFDVFIMNVNGGEAKRLTYHSTNETPACFGMDDSLIYFSAVRQDKASCIQYPTGLMSEFYSVPVTGGRVNQVLNTPAIDAKISRNGNLLIYHDVKGYEDNWRKHHTSAVTRDIWTYNFTDNKYMQMTDFEGEDRNLC
jgi:tricorn protease